MSTSNLAQLLIGAGLLTAAFYFGIHSKGSTFFQQTSVAKKELPDADLSLNTPLLPPDESSAQLPKSTVGSVSADLLPNLDTNEQSAKQNVRKPDFSSLKFNRAAQTEGSLDALHRDRNADNVRPESSLATAPTLPIEQTKAPELMSTIERPGFTADRRNTMEAIPKRFAADNDSRFQPLLPLEDTGELDMGQSPSPSSNPNSVLQKPFRNEATQPLRTETRLSPIESQQISLADLPNSSSFRIHVVRTGESLQTIASRYYQSRDYYLEIYLANQDILESPIQLPVGVTLKIPDLVVK